MAVYKEWKSFCNGLNKLDVPCKSLCAIIEEEYKGSFFALKHDVESKVKKAYKLCKIESDAGFKGTYYVQHYLLKKEKNVKLLKKMQDMGAEICYHHDVMDANRGDMEKATADFEQKIGDFKALGFYTRTVCQHGNPVVERVGYSSNRDFFRKEETQKLFSETADVMVNYKEKIGDYVYISDAGKKWKIIYDPENNDIINSDDKNVVLQDLREVVGTVEEDKRVIISTHPHRWARNSFTSFLGTLKFKLIRGIAKILLKIPFMKKLMARFYYLAKKV